MSHVDPSYNKKITAGADLEAGRFVTAAGVYPAAGAKPAGVTVHAAKSGKPVTITIFGLVKVQGAAAIAAGADVCSDANGRAVVSATSGHVVCGKMVEPTRALVSSKADQGLILLDHMFLNTIA